MDRKAFFDAIRKPLFDGKLAKLQVARIEAVLDGLESRKVKTQHAAYILATAHHETMRWKKLEEMASGAAYEGRKDLGNTQKGDGQRFKGRGLVQITGRANYTDWSKRLGVDLVGDPKLAKDVRYAVPILIDGMLLGTFTGRKLSDYRRFYEMRQVVNRLDRAADIAVYALHFQDALEDAGYGESATLPTPAPTPDPTPTPTPEAPRKGLFAVLAAILKAIFRGGK